MINKEIKLWNLVARYKIYTELLSKHQDETELLSKKIEDSKNEILDYITSDITIYNRLKEANI